MWRRNCSAIVASLFFLVSFSGEARADATYDSLVRLIHQVRTERIAAVTASQVSDVLQGLLAYSPVDGQDVKQKLFAGLARKRAEELAGLLDPADGAFFLLLYYTREGVPDNLTDVGLHRAVGGNGQHLIHSTVKNAFADQPITPDLYNALANFPPHVAAQYLDVLCNPWFVMGVKPYGAPHGQETYASDSYFSVVYAIRRVEFARQSVVVRLLDHMGVISIPASVDAQFDYSGDPDVTIPLSPPVLTVDDIPELENLLSNPYYGVAAQMAIDDLQSQ